MKKNKKIKDITKAKLKLHKLELRASEGAEGRVATGANSALYMDGKKLRGVSKFNLNAEARGLVKATIELYVRL